MPPAESPGAIWVDFGYTPGATGLEGVRKPHPTRAVGISQETAPAVRAAGQDPC